MAYFAEKSQLIKFEERTLTYCVKKSPHEMSSKLSLCAECFRTRERSNVSLSHLTDSHLIVCLIVIVLYIKCKIILGKKKVGVETVSSAGCPEALPSSKPHGTKSQKD